MELNQDQIQMPKPDILKLKEKEYTQKAKELRNLKEEEGLELDPNNSDKNTNMLNK